MPEMPEVETIVRGLREPLQGRTIRAVRVLWEGSIARPAPAEFTRALAGRRIAGVGRRGKYVVISLDAGSLLVHLMMSGRLRLACAGEPAGPHTRAVLELDDGWHLCFDDVRKFGRIALVETPDLVTGRLGPEPTGPGFSLEALRSLLAGRSGRLKPLLLDQRFLAGIGNIYGDEVLFAAGLHPLRSARSLSGEEQQRLYCAIREVLALAVKKHGTTLTDGGYTRPDGEAGEFQELVAVYGRTGQPCRRCGTAVKRIVVGQRSSHFCPSCQPPP